MPIDPEIACRLRQHGISCSFVKMEHLPQLKEEIASGKERGLIDTALYGAYLSYFRFSVPRTLPGARCIVVMSIPQSALAVTFQRHGRMRQLVVPPTYADFRTAERRVRSLIKEAVGDRHRFIRCRLPLKLLASKSGLTSYGRNNIAYAPVSGSYIQLMAFFTDCQCTADGWQDSEPKVLPLCATCDLCIKACPTGAILKDRFRIASERCITYFSEMPAEKQFPQWVDFRAQGTIIGCMACQEACPYNKKVKLQCEARASFTEEETDFLLRGGRSGPLKVMVERKLKRAGLDLTVFPRNLAAHLC